MCILIYIKIHRILTYFEGNIIFPHLTKHYIFSLFIQVEFERTKLFIVLCIFVFLDPSILIIIQPDHQGHPASVSSAPVHRHEHHRRTLSSRTSSSSSSTSSFLRFSIRLRIQDSRSRLSFQIDSIKSCWFRHVSQLLQSCKLPLFLSLYSFLFSLYLSSSLAPLTRSFLRNTDPRPVRPLFYEYKWDMFHEVSVMIKELRKYKRDIPWYGVNYIICFVAPMCSSPPTQTHEYLKDDLRVFLSEMFLSLVWVIYYHRCFLFSDINPHKRYSIFVIHWMLKKRQNDTCVDSCR